MIDYRRPARRPARRRIRRLPGRRAAAQARRRARRPRRRRRSSSSGSPCATSTRRATPTCRASCSRRMPSRSSSAPTSSSSSWAASSRPARYVLQAINSGADVVTANKALLATHGPEIFDAAEQVGAQRVLRGRRRRRDPDHPAAARLARRRPRAAHHRHRQRHDELHPRPHGHRGRRLRRRRSPTRRRLGYAEADPTADVEGYDAAQKAAILASLAFHTDGAARRRAPRGHHRDRQGRRSTPRATPATSSSCSPCASGSSRRRDGRGDLASACTRRSIRRDHPLASVHGANNAVFVEAEAAGNLMFYGAGAGGVQTASAVLGDVVSAARRHIAGGIGVGESTRANLPDRCRSAASRPATRSRSRSMTGPACSRRSPASSATAASRSRPSSRPSSTDPDARRPGRTTRDRNPQGP